MAAMSFVAMEGVSYSAHRWLMHGRAMRWHRSHHVRATTRIEANDIFPLAFSGVAMATFLTANRVRAASGLWPIGCGITLYGASYLAVHELYIHRRLPWSPKASSSYLEWLRRAHAAHHLVGGEPFGMLLPVGRWPQAELSDVVGLERRVSRSAIRPQS